MWYNDIPCKCHRHCLRLSDLFVTDTDVLLSYLEDKNENVMSSFDFLNDFYNKGNLIVT